MLTIDQSADGGLTRDQVLFSWALAEAYSPRWREDYASHLSPVLLEKVYKADVASLNDQDKNVMIDLLRKRRTYLIETYIDQAAHFRLIQVPIDVLELLPIMPSFSWKDDPVLLGHYIDWDRNAEWTNDPRNHAEAMIANPPPAVPYTGYPILAYSFQTRCDVLIEGYVRCITKLWGKRQGEQIPPITMVYCEVEQNRRLKGFYKP